MLKTEFINMLAQKNLSGRQSAEKILNAFLDSVEDALALDGTLRLREFGVFEVITVKERSYKNFHSKDPVLKPAMKKARFRPSASLLRKINEM